MRPRTPQHLESVVSPTDLVIAVCDNAHEELPADIQRVHWSIPDPARTGSDAAFDRALSDLSDRISHLAPSCAPTSNGANNQ